MIIRKILLLQRIESINGNSGDILLDRDYYQQLSMHVTLLVLKDVVKNPTELLMLSNL